MMGLSQRKQYARQCLYKGRSSRGFDNCFEMGDGGEVVKYLMSKAKTDKRLERAIKDFNSWDYWLYFIEHGNYEGFPDN